MGYVEVMRYIMIIRSKWCVSVQYSTVQYCTVQYSTVHHSAK